MLPIRMISTVVRGFGRGSKDLGIPTANLDRDALQSSTPFDDLPTGIYWGYARIGNSHNNEDDDGDHSTSLTAAISIGYNPTYGNAHKTVEPHLIASTRDPRRHASSTGETLLQDFYDQTCRLSVIDYLRPELPFEGLDKLVEAIKMDIVNAEQRGNDASSDARTLAERHWVSSNETVG
jgi:riboflavin kinase